jgi:diaminohydroxyphosphoribosylaminopyrimidine deaminase/5-amino-6-(5-phosphoribosylamino)uracil reductase
MAAEARELNVGFFSRFERGRPFVRLKMAMSLDARTAPASGGRQWISGTAARTDVQVWRARSSAVLTGAGTVRIDDPQLDVRLSYGPFVRQPLRVVLDTELRCAPGARIFAGGGALVFAAPDPAGHAPHGAPPAAEHLAQPDPPPAQQGVAIERVPRASGGVDLHVVMQRLAAREVNELLVECGPTLAGAIAAAGLVDELILYVAPTLLGEKAAPLMRVGAPGVPGVPGALGALPDFEFRDLQRIGDDVRLILNRKRS